MYSYWPNFNLRNDLDYLILCQSTVLALSRWGSKFLDLQLYVRHRLGTWYFPSEKLSLCNSPHWWHWKFIWVTKGLTEETRTTVPRTERNLSEMVKQRRKKETVNYQHLIRSKFPPLSLLRRLDFRVFISRIGRTLSSRMVILGLSEESAYTNFKEHLSSQGRMEIWDLVVSRGKVEKKNRAFPSKFKRNLPHSTPGNKRWKNLEVNQRESRFHSHSNHEVLSIFLDVPIEKQLDKFADRVTKKISRRKQNRALHIMRNLCRGENLKCASHLEKGVRSKFFMVVPWWKRVPSQKRKSVFQVAVQ